MAIKVSTGMVRQATVTPKTMGFDPDVSVVSAASRAAAKGLKQMSQDIERVNLKINQDMEEQSKIRDKVTTDNVLSNYKNTLATSYDNLMTSFASGDEEKINEAKSNWDLLNPEKGLDYNLYSEGGTVSDKGVFERYGVDNKIKELYTTNNLRANNELIKQENLVSVKKQQATTRKSILDLQTAYSEVEIPEEEFDIALNTIADYLNHSSVQSLKASGSVAEWRNDAENMLTGLFEHQLALTTNNDQKTELLKKWNEVTTSDEFANIKSTTLLNFATTVAKAKKNHIAAVQSTLKDAGVESLNKTSSILRSTTTKDPYRQPNQETLENINTDLIGLLDVHNSNLKDGVSLFSTAQLAKLESSIALTSVQIDDEEDGLSVLDTDIISSIQKQSFNLEASADDLVPAVLADATEEIKTEYRTVRNELITTIKTSLDKGDTRVLEYFTSDQSEQRAILNDLGYSRLSLYKEPITTNEFKISSNREDIDGSVLYIRDALTSNNLKELSTYAGNLMNNPQSDGDYQKGLVYMAMARASTKEEALQLGEEFVIKLGNYKQDSEAYNLLSNGPDEDIKQLIRNVEGFAATRESFVADQISFFGSQGNQQAVQFYKEIQNAAIMDSINSIMNSADKSKPWYNILMLGLADEKRETAKRNLYVSFNADKIDSELERLLVAKPAEDIIAKIGYYGQSEDYGTNVYVAPEVFATGVNVVLYGRSSGYRAIMGDQEFELPFGIDLIDPVQTITQNLSQIATGDYTATLKQVEDRVTEVNFMALSGDSNFIVDDIFTPTDVKAQRSLAYSSGRKKFYEETKDQLAKIKSLQDDPLALAEHLATITIKDSAGIARAAFDFSQNTVDSNNNPVTQVQYFNPTNDRYEPLNYVARGEDGNYLQDADGNLIVLPFTIATSKQVDLLNQYGLGAFEKQDDPSLIAPLPAASYIQTEYRESIRAKNKFSN